METHQPPGRPESRIRLGRLATDLVQMAFDGLAWFAGLTLAQVGRYDFHVAHVLDTGLWVCVVLACALQFFTGTALHLYLGRYRFGGFEEVRGLMVSAGLTATGLLLADLLSRPHRPVPASVPVLGGTVALVLMFGTRYGWRLWRERGRRPHPDIARPLVVFGAGDGAYRILQALLHDPRSPYFPVALLDDDPAKSNLQLAGVRVRGGREAIAPIAQRYGARTLLVAIPSVEAAELRDITRLAEENGMRVKVLPPTGDLIDGRVGIEDIRDLDLLDLLGRHQVDTDVGAIAGYLTGRRVMVTGAGGSIGSELCRQIMRYAPAELIMLDRDESALHAVQLSLSGRALLDTPDLVLADIRDPRQVRRVFAQRRPQVVFHAAALKHLTMLERHPGEAVKTNVWGSLGVLEAAAATGVERLVNISTDKAANPVSVLGYSKRIAERLTSAVAESAEGTFVSVRFGNVLGSRGSVLTTFSAQIAAGGPVTVTHPDVTRYFMTIPEAVELVVQAGALGRRGDALVLDMGEPVRIADVARRLAADAPRPVELVYTGLRDGEKLHEELLGDGERDVRPHHPLISHVGVPMLDPALVRAIDADGPDDVVAERLRHYALAHDLVGAPAFPDGDDDRGRRQTDAVRAADGSVDGVYPAEPGRRPAPSRPVQDPARGPQR